MKLLGISGRKQSGKTTVFNCILGIEMMQLAIIRNRFEITPLGKLLVSDIFGNTDHAGVFDPERDNNSMRDFLSEYVSPYIKSYGFADILKRIVCIDILGLSHTACYGTDAEKMELTHLKWEDMPGVTTEEVPQDPVDIEVAGRLGKYYEKCLSGVVYHKPGFMSGREVMQYVGTEIFRKMHNPVWIDSCLRNIVKEGSLFPIVPDCRFPNEVEAIQKVGGKVIRLTRNGEDPDVHSSERELDRDVYDWNKFDVVIDNANMTIGEQNHEILRLLSKWGWTERVVEGA